MVDEISATLSWCMDEEKFRYIIQYRLCWNNKMRPFPWKVVFQETSSRFKQDYGKRFADE